ncbi:MAG: hypothetical protein ACTH1Z_07975 [Ancrocorticia sp.]|uniref:hypothetical protein n=1 Tax=Ancrocorticia sp. TaxID=2593684 RepID=UPI003F8E2DFC
MAEHRQEGAFGHGGALSRRRRPEKGGGTKRAVSSDVRAARARELHATALEADELAARQRAQRDELIMRLRNEDPKRWSYGALAAAIGCSRELIALIARRND